MAKTSIRGGQVLDGSIKRKDLNIDNATNAVVRRIVAGTGVTLSSTGAATGTGDVTINSDGGGGGGLIPFSEQTTNNTITTLGSIEIPDNVTTTFTAWVSGRGPSNKNIWAVIQGGVRKNASENAVLIDTPIITIGDEGSAGYVIDVDVNLENLRIRVTGATAETVDWEAKVLTNSEDISGGISVFEWSATEQVWPFEKDASGNTLYCKEIDIGALPNSGQKSVAHSITGFTANIHLNRLSGRGFGTTSAIPLPFTATVASQAVMLFCNNTNILVDTAIDYSAFTGRAQIIYRK